MDIDHAIAQIFVQIRTRAQSQGNVTWAECLQDAERMWHLGREKAPETHAIRVAIDATILGMASGPYGALMSEWVKLATDVFGLIIPKLPEAEDEAAELLAGLPPAVALRVIAIDLIRLPTDIDESQRFVVASEIVPDHYLWPASPATPGGTVQIAQALRSSGALLRQVHATDLTAQRYEHIGDLMLKRILKREGKKDDATSKATLEATLDMMRTVASIVNDVRKAMS